MPGVRRRLGSLSNALRVQGRSAPGARATLRTGWGVRRRAPPVEAAHGLPRPHSLAGLWNRTSRSLHVRAPPRVVRWEPVSVAARRDIAKRSAVLGKLSVCESQLRARDPRSRVRNLSGIDPGVGRMLLADLRGRNAVPGRILLSGRHRSGWCVVRFDERTGDGVRRRACLQRRFVSAEAEARRGMYRRPVWNRSHVQRQHVHPVCRIAARNNRARRRSRMRGFPDRRVQALRELHRWHVSIAAARVQVSYRRHP
jgi:hypothetical protein